MPTSVAGLSVSALPFRAYNLIYNEWYRDENLQDSVTVDVSNGPDITDYQLLKRNKRRDYFTSSLPWPQKGEAVDLPLGISAPIVGIGDVAFSANSVGVADRGLFSLSGLNGPYVAGANPGTTEKMYWPSNNLNLIADLSDATAATINSLREAFQVQRMLERDARGGTRYIEILRSHFGVTAPDFRLQRPEYLGGFTTHIGMTQVPQTSSTDATTPQGNLSAFGQAMNMRKGFKKSFVEHGLIIGLTSVRADLTYQQGINRMWSRKTRYDFYWPSLAHLGEQEVLNKEIFAQGTTVDDEVFGYQERYSEYRYKPNLICGQFRSNFAQSLDIWHYAQEFDALPALNADFIKEQPPIARTIAVQDYPEFIMDISFRCDSYRPMPVYSQPGLIDHF